MNIIKITGLAGSGKSTALTQLAAVHQTWVIPGTRIMAMMPRILDGSLQLHRNTFVDEVTPDMFLELKKLNKICPDAYHLYVAGEIL